MKQIIVKVDGLTIEEKQRVNEALAKITNVSKIREVTADMVWFYAPSSFGMRVGWDSILKSESPTHTPQQVIEMAREEGHVHAELMAQYAEDAKTHTEPWELWQVRGDDGVWKDCQRKGSVDGWQHCPHHPAWWCATEYRRKPKTHIVNGVEIPDLRVTPKYDEYYYLANPLSDYLFTRYSCTENSSEELWAKRGLTYKSTKEGKQAAILHSKAMLGIA